MPKLRSGLTVAALLAPFALAACTQTESAGTAGQAAIQPAQPGPTTAYQPSPSGLNYGLGSGRPLPGSFPGGFSPGTINPETGTRTGAVQ